MVTNNKNHKKALYLKILLSLFLAIFFTMHNRMISSVSNTQNVGAEVSSIEEAEEKDGSNEIEADATAEAEVDSAENEIEKESVEEEEAPIKSIYADGIYTGIGEGYGGDIELSIEMKDGKIVEIIILDDSKEDAPYMKEAKRIIPKIIEKQHTDLDAISGATKSAWGILDAVDEAMSKARDDFNEE